jgi:FdhD protein
VAETRPIHVLAVRGGQIASQPDAVAAEEPLEIRVEGPGRAAETISVTMRTPGEDAELAVGFLFTEGLIRGCEDLAAPPVRELPIEGGANNVATVRLVRPFDASRLQRNFYATSSCGICGKASIDAVHTAAAPIQSDLSVARELIASLPGKLRAAQAAFASTGGLHATGLFDRRGELVLAREDVGRHNAMDKVVGRALLDRLTPLSTHVLLVSGRLSFELVQKAAMAGAPLLAAVSAPSSLAIQAADRLGITLVGFVRGDGLNIYTHAHRVTWEPLDPREPGQYAPAHEAPSVDRAAGS